MLKGARRTCVWSKAGCLRTSGLNHRPPPNWKAPVRYNGMGERLRFALVASIAASLRVGSSFSCCMRHNSQKFNYNPDEHWFAPCL